MEPESRTYNNTFAKGGVSCSAYSFVLRISISGKNPVDRKSENSYKLN